MERRGHWERWSQILHTAIANAQMTDEPSRLPPLALSHARLLSRQIRYRESISAYSNAIKLANRTNDDFSKARAWSNLGYLFIELDQWWRAEILCCYALQIFESMQSKHGQAHTHNHLGILYTRQCKWGAAWEHLEKAIGLWQKMNDKQGLLLGNLNLGKLANDMRMEEIEPPHPAASYLEQVIRDGEQAEDEVMVAVARMNLGIVHKLDENFDEAARLFRKSEHVFERYGDLLNIALISDNLGVNQGDYGCKEEAIAHFKKALSIWRELKSTYGECRTLLYLADWEKRLGSRDAAQEWLAEAGQILERHEEEQKYHALFSKFQRLSSSLSS